MVEHGAKISCSLLSSSFGGEVYGYSFLSMICDPLRYSKLVERREAAPDLPTLRTNFFPKYRA